MITSSSAYSIALALYHRWIVICKTQILYRLQIRHRKIRDKAENRRKSKKTQAARMLFASFFECLGKAIQYKTTALAGGVCISNVCPVYQSERRYGLISIQFFIPSVHIILSKSLGIAIKTAIPVVWFLPQNQRLTYAALLSASYRMSMVATWAREASPLGLSFPLPMPLII